MGESWHYATDMLPLTYTEQQTAGVLSRATPDVVSRSWHLGNPDQMAKAITPYLDAGVTFVQIVDFLPLARPAEEAPEGLRRAFELAAAIKQHSRTPQ